MGEKESKPMRKWKLWSGLAVLFLSGVLIGALSTGLFMKHSLERSLHQGEPGVRHLVMNRLTRQLNLTESQKEYAEKVLCRTQSELRRLRQSHRPEFEEVMQRAIVDFKKELTPEQQRKLDTMYERARLRWEGHGKGFGQGKGRQAACD